MFRILTYLFAASLAIALFAFEFLGGELGQVMQLAFFLVILAMSSALVFQASLTRKKSLR